MILRLLKDLITETEHSEPSTVKQEQDTYGNYDTQHIVDYYARGSAVIFPSSAISGSKDDVVHVFVHGLMD
jgi:hypothetical protein